jgi:ABC-2 type transport system ATP-binding protein
VVKRWPDAPPIVEGVDLELDPGTAITISGHNGAGKTTLLRIASGLIEPDSGVVCVAGRRPEENRTEFQRRIGLVSAGNTGLYGRLKAEHHLDLWARLALIPRAARDAAIERAIRAFALEPLCGKRVDRLSMGQRQRLRLALGFLHDPALVLLDEPTTSLDEDGVELLGTALEALKARGGAAIVCLPSGWGPLPALDGHMTLRGGRLEPA